MSGLIVWMTGLSGSGKSTLTSLFTQDLSLEGIHVKCLDGDEVRKNLSHGLGFSREDRDRNVRRIGCVARMRVEATFRKALALTNAVVLAVSQTHLARWQELVALAGERVTLLGLSRDFPMSVTRARLVVVVEKSVGASASRWVS